ncbi:MAG: hypothetical protein ABI616_12540 [Pseudomonadota bacterium]
MSNKTVLIEKHRKALEQVEPSAPLDYIQLRNQEALREWRFKLACASIQGVPRPTRNRFRDALASFHLHANGVRP